MKQCMVILLLGGLVIFSGCDLSPSDKTSKKAIKAVIHGFMASVYDQEVQVARPFQNVIDKQYVSADQSTLHTIRIILNNDDTKTFSGACVFSGYVDAETGLGIGGEFSYKGLADSRNIGTVELTCQVALIGSDVNKLEIKASGTLDGNVDEYAIRVNGEDFRFNKWDKLLEIEWRFLMTIGKSNVVVQPRTLIRDAGNMQN